MTLHLQHERPRDDTTPWAAWKCCLWSAPLSCLTLRDVLHQKHACFFHERVHRLFVAREYTVHTVLWITLARMLDQYSQVAEPFTGLGEYARLVYDYVDLARICTVDRYHQQRLDELLRGPLDCIDEVYCDVCTLLVLHDREDRHQRLHCRLDVEVLDL